MRDVGGKRSTIGRRDERAVVGLGPGKRTLTEMLPRAGRDAAKRQPGAPDAIHTAARRGITTAASPLPHAELIQRLFGHHDISGVKAHTGPDASASASAMGARAYASGDHIVLGSERHADSASDLFTEAHEAAHIVQQRGGLQLANGLGQKGDPHEQHADRVASLVTQGKSAEGLLDQAATPGTRTTTSSQPHALQRQEAGEGEDDSQLCSSPEIVTAGLPAFSLAPTAQPELSLIEGGANASEAAAVPEAAAEGAITSTSEAVAVAPEVAAAAPEVAAAAPEVAAGGGALDAIGGFLVGVGEAVTLGAVALGAGLAVTEAAIESLFQEPAWADNTNPITKQPYRSRDEWDAVQELRKAGTLAAAIEEAEAARRKQKDDDDRREEREDQKQRDLARREQRTLGVREKEQPKDEDPTGPDCSARYPNMTSCEDPEIGGVSRQIYETIDEAMEPIRKVYPDAREANRSTANQAGSLNDDRYATSHVGIETATGLYVGTIFVTQCCEDTPDGPRTRQVYTSNFRGR